MTTQALPSWDAEMQRQVTATTVAQYRIVELEAIVNRERARADTFQAAHRMAERHVAELLLSRSAADREVGALTGERDELRRQVEELRGLKAQEVRG
jgi:hypothetical protein